MKKCYNCREEHDGSDMLCEVCKPYGIHQFPGVAGVSDGPGSCNNEMIFDRPDAKKDIELTCKKMEANGTFLRNPKMKALAEYKWKKAQTMSYQKADYQKTGVPGGIGGRMV